MAKKEKIVDLKSKPEKVTDIQLKKIQNVVSQINRLQMELGMMETKKHAILHHVGVCQESVGSMRTKFEEEYGTSDIDIQTGTINYTPENGETNKED